MPIKFKLQSTLDELNISRNKLSVEGKIRLATLYEMAHDQSKAIKLDTLDSIIATINRIAKSEGKRIINVSDIIEYVPDESENKEKPTNL
ncbi:helix-turn-helix domain-containing protein [Paenibacillus piri]|uniref:XRE family transcriptional regulator n=1 Tax=Paenibacillus piri TaxID=2547395 RepID=A0A4R5KVW4_9BACL|nr:XRE family transcriptional regulator [Paenibacillus piri]TDG00142.1 XRE family transcriptional regulator [Paenibacillus piri]